MSDHGDRSEEDEAKAGPRAVGAGTDVGDRPVVSRRRDDWSEEEYFALDTNQLVEYSDGFLEFLPMPTIFHQLILQYLYEKLESFVTAEKLGTVVTRRLQGSASVPASTVSRTSCSSRRRIMSRIEKQYCEKSRSGHRGCQRGEPRARHRERSGSNTPRPASPSTGSSTPRKRRSPCWCSKPRQKTYAEHGRFRQGYAGHIEAASRLLGRCDRRAFAETVMSSRRSARISRGGNSLQACARKRSVARLELDDDDRALGRGADVDHLAARP